MTSRHEIAPALRSAGVLLALAALVFAAPAATAPTSVRNYFGTTSKGMPVQLDLQGPVLTKHSFVDGQMVNRCEPGNTKCTKQQWLTDVISLNPLRDIPFPGAKLSYHRVYASGHAEEWLDLRRTPDGRTITGWLRQTNHFPGYGPSDSGKVTFTTRLWASSEGAEWTGKTSDGRPLTMSVGYRSSDADVPFTVDGLTRPLTCRQPGGGAATFPVTVPKIEGSMRGLYWRGERRYQYPGHTTTPGRGAATTDDGLTVRATLTVSTLAPQGGSLVATGAVRLEGSATGDTGSYPCAPVTTRFTLRPR